MLYEEYTDYVQNFVERWRESIDNLSQYTELPNDKLINSLT